jgi:threonine/homoserine/homoserine lactone efflux protein
MDARSKLSTLWIFATLNYLYCDVVTLMDPNLLKQFMAGDIGSIHISQAFLLGAGVLVEIPMAMVLFSRILSRRPNRWANIAAGTFMTVVQLLSLVAKTPTLYYAFFSVVEIASTSVIVWYAWKWRSDERARSAQAESLPSASVAR